MCRSHRDLWSSLVVPNLDNVIAKMNGLVKGATRLVSRILHFNFAGGQ